MEITGCKLIVIFTITLFLIGCERKENKSIMLFSEYHQHDTVVPDRSLRINYERNPKVDFVKAMIMSSTDSSIAVYYQKVSDS